MLTDSRPLNPALNEEIDVPPFDRERFHVLSAFAGENTHILEEIVQHFEEGMTRLLRRLAAAVSAQDLPQIADIGHTLKGNGAMLGMERLQRLATRMENAAKDGAVSTAIAYAPLLEEAYGAALPELRRALLG
jgi:HPt (histidine-containing phosphotransfer) domain-containing protein